MKYSCILFDLDGTLLDTIDDLADAVNVAMRRYALAEYSVADVTRFVGNGLENLMTRCIPGGYEHPRFWEIYHDFKEYYLAHSRIKTKPYAGIPALLQKLHAEGRKMAVISNKNDIAVKDLNTLFFDGIIDVAIGEQSGVPKKPQPDSVQNAIRLLGAQPEECVYIGDSEVDILTARNAKLPCICVTWGFRSEQALLSAGATTLAHSTQALYDLL